MYATLFRTYKVKMQISKTETYIHSPLCYNISERSFNINATCRMQTMYKDDVAYACILLYDIFSKTLLSIAYILDKLPNFHHFP